MITEKLKEPDYFLISIDSNSEFDSLHSSLIMHSHSRIKGLKFHNS